MAYSESKTKLAVWKPVIPYVLVSRYLLVGFTPELITENNTVGDAQVKPALADAALMLAAVAVKLEMTVTIVASG